MDVRKMTLDELELLSFTDIAYNIIKVDKELKTTVQLFKEICSLLKLNKNQFEEKIADFFTSLTTDKRFVLLDSVNWDLKENHLSTITLDEDDDLEDLDDLDDYILDDELDDDYDDDEEEDNIEPTDDSLDDLSLVDDDLE